MDAIVLVGGQGTRLRPLTARRHKSLVPVLNRPAVEYLFDWLETSGFQRAVLALGRDNDDLAAAYPDGRRGKLEIVTVQERERLESGGAIRNAVQSAGIEGRYAVLNGDVFVEFDFGAMLDAHVARGAKLTQYLYRVPDPWRFGVAVVDGDGMVVGFVEKPPMGEEPGNLINAGVWLFEPELTAAIPPGAVRVEETLFPSLVARGQPVLGFTADGTWADIGTPASYLALNQALVGRLPGAVALHPDATVSTLAFVETSCAGRGSTVAEGAAVRDSVLWEGVTVERGARVSASVLADGVVVGEGAVLDRAVVGSGAVIAPGAVLLPGTSVDAGARYDATND